MVAQERVRKSSAVTAIVEDRYCFDFSSRIKALYNWSKGDDVNFTILPNAPRTSA